MGSWQRAQAQTEPLELAQTSLSLSLSLSPPNRISSPSPAPCRPAASCSLSSASCTEASLGPVPPMTRGCCVLSTSWAPRAGCGWLRGCSGWTRGAAGPSASPRVSWPVWRRVGALCDGQGCSASTKTALKALSISSRRSISRAGRTESALFRPF